MKIAVVIPTRNEVRTIAAVVATADAGLAALGGPALIVNADGGSDDGTGPAFLATPTRTPKRLLAIDGPPGKGRNLLAAWTFCLDEGFGAASLVPLVSLRALTVWSDIAPLQAGEVDVAAATEVPEMRSALADAAGWIGRHDADAAPRYERRRSALS